MTDEQAINVLVQVAELAQSRGLLKLNEAPVVFQAVSTLSPKENEVVNNNVTASEPQGEEVVRKPKAVK